jgi:hypothetical protein
MMKAFAVATVLGAVIAPALAKGSLTPIEVRGNAFYKGEERFYVRGVAYQPGMF